MTSTERFDLPDLERLVLASRRLGGGILFDTSRPLPCGGTELSGYRDYSAGDDYRHIDWNVCARHDELRVRQFAGGRDCRVYLLLDSSASMGLGKPVARFILASRIVAALGYAALDRLAELTVATFSDRVEHWIGPLRGKGRAGRLLREVSRLAPGRGRTDFLQAARTFVRSRRGDGPVIVISDLGDPAAFFPGIDVLRLAGCPPRVVHIDDPCEADEVAAGDLELADVESGDVWQVTLSEGDLRRYQMLLAEQRELVRRYCTKWRVPYVRAGLDLPERRVLEEVFRTRSRPE